MKTNFEDLKRLDKVIVPENTHNIMLSDNPIENVLEDLKEFRIFEQVNACKDIDDVIKCLKTIQNIKTEQGFIQIPDAVDSVLEARFDPSIENLLEVVSNYGIRSKVIEIIHLQRKQKLGKQIVMEL